MTEAAKTQEPQARKGTDAEGNPVLITLEETEAGTAMHVEPDPDPENADDNTEPNGDENEDVETGKKGTRTTDTEDDEYTPSDGNAF